MELIIEFKVDHLDNSDAGQGSDKSWLINPFRMNLGLSHIKTLVKLLNMDSLIKTNFENYFRVFPGQLNYAGMKNLTIPIPIDYKLFTQYNKHTELIQFDQHHKLEKRLPINTLKHFAYMWWSCELSASNTCELSASNTCASNTCKLSASNTCASINWGIDVFKDKILNKYYPGIFNNMQFDIPNNLTTLDLKPIETSMEDN